MSGSYIVSLKPGRGLTARSDAGRELARKYGATIRHTYGSALNGYSVRLSEAQAKRLAADPAVASVSQDARVRIAAPSRTRPPGAWTASTRATSRSTTPTPRPPTAVRA